jgi:hypothetical protein
MPAQPVSGGDLLKRPWLRTLAIIVVVVVVLFVAIQFIPVQLTSPPVVSEPNWDSPQTRALAVRACFDCHSNETVWPFYSRIAPASWLIAFDVNQGRRRLNFSDWSSGGRFRRGEAEMAETIADGSMPPWFYLPLHPAARLSATEKVELVQGLNATIANSP